MLRFVLVAFSLVVLSTTWISRAGARTADGSVSGIVWRDDNADGQRQSGEPGLAFPIYLRSLQTGQTTKTLSNALERPTGG